MTLYDAIYGVGRRTGVSQRGTIRSEAVSDDLLGPTVPYSTSVIVALGCRKFSIMRPHRAVTISANIKEGRDQVSAI